MKKSFGSLRLSGVIALAFTISLNQLGFAATPLNSVQDGRIINGGAYFNTADNKTTFTNSGPGGLWLKAGTNVRGLEVNASGTLTNHGGTLHFYAPGQVVRIDGNVNVNANANAQGIVLGNGGNVFVDSAYLFQNGNILASGKNGGLVQINVGGMTLGSGATIQAKGLNGAGGVVAINSNGPVDIKRTSVIDTSGHVVGSFDNNLINIEGSLVNNEGTLRADGAADGSRGGTIRLVSTGQSDLQDISSSLQAATQNPSGDNSAPTISASERTFILQRTNALILNHDGDIVLSRNTQNATPTYNSLLSANGTGGNFDQNDNTATPYSPSPPRSGDGGTVILNAMHDAINQGYIQANGAAGQYNSPNGGDGGTVSILAQGSILNDHGRIEANGGAGAFASIPYDNVTLDGGYGGKGGLLSFGYNNGMTNSGNLYADGAIGGSTSLDTRYVNFAGRAGTGGFVIFSGDNNPIGNGSIDVIGRPGGNNDLRQGGKSGTIVSPNPTSLGNTQVYFQRGYEDAKLVSNRAQEQTQVNELITHAENLILLTKNGGSLAIPSNLFLRLLYASIRSVDDPTAVLGTARNEVIFKNTGTSNYVYRNLILGSSRDNAQLVMDHPWSIDNNFESKLTLPSALSKGQAFTTLNTLNVVNDGTLQTQSFGTFSDGFVINSPVNFWDMGRSGTNLGGGHISLLANGNIANTNLLATSGLMSGGSINIASTGAYSGSGYLDSSYSDGTTSHNAFHGGSIMVKGTQGIHANAVAGEFASTFVNANGSVIGGTIRYSTPQDFIYNWSEDGGAIRANGSLQGGVISIRAGHDSITSPQGVFDAPEIANNLIMTANGTSPTAGRGGYISIHAGHNNIRNSLIEANGGLQNGQLIFTSGTP